MKWIALLLFLPYVTSKAWHGLSFDSEHFMCEEFDEFCETILDDVNCGLEDRQMEGCRNYPENKNMADWVGRCECSAPVAYSAGTRVTQQLINNRIYPDMSWMLEPWDSGPPYDVILSYKNICNKVLGRLGCDEADKTVFAQEELLSDGNGDPIPGSNFKCTCGNMTTATSSVNTLMMDKMNDYNQRSTPIFANPVYLSVPISMCIVLITGKIGAIIAVYLKLPPIIGFLLVGLGIQNILSPMFLKGAGYPYPSPASEIKLIALVIVLMRAGLAIKFDEISANALATFLLSTLPYIAEFFAFMYIGKTYFTSFSTITMGLFASIMAPLGPSVVISGLLNLMASPKRNPGHTGKQVLISTPIEAVLAIVLFGIFSNLEQTGEKNSLYPWVKSLPLLENCLLIPANLLFSTVLGILVGMLASYYIDWRSHQKTDFIWYRVNKNPQMGSSTADLVFVLLVLCYTMMSLCTNQYIQQCSGVLVVFVASITVSKMANPEIVADIAMGLKGIWVFAEVFLFTLTGTSLSFDNSNGPLYGQRGLSSALMSDVVSVLFAASACRFVSVGISCLLLWKTLPIHRQSWKWIVPFWINLYIFQLPKATVQATLGSVAYYQKIIPGPEGLNQGLIIAQSTAFAVLIFAPLGALLTNYVGSPLAVYLRKLDHKAGWNEETREYDKKDDVVKDDDEPGLELSDLPRMILADEEDEEEETAVGPHGEVLHEPENIVKDIKKIIRQGSIRGIVRFNSLSMSDPHYDVFRRERFNSQSSAASGNSAEHHAHAAALKVPDTEAPTDSSAKTMEATPAKAEGSESLGTDKDSVAHTDDHSSGGAV